MNADLIRVHPRKSAAQSAKNMRGNKSKDLPVFRSVDELVAFFETHDMGEYLEKLLELKVEVRLKKKVSTGTISKKKGPLGRDYPPSEPRRKQLGFMR